MILSPGHPLYGAQLRVRRAMQLRGTLRRQLQRWTDAQALDSHLSYTEIAPLVFAVNQENPPVEHLFRASVTVGEIAYNCRAALDYLIQELAVAGNRGQPVMGTQFPIDDDEPMFRARVTGKHPTDSARRVRRYLRKVPSEAVDVISGLQPFAGCEWTRLLRDVSNPDKHRYVPLISSRADLRNPSFDTETGLLRGTIAVRVVFEHDPETEVVGGLARITREVAALIDGFAPAFVAKPDRTTDHHAGRWREPPP